MELPQDDVMSSSIAEKLLLFQCFGSQFDVPLEDLHLHALGFPIFDPSCPSVCGHQCPDHAEFPPENALNSPSPTDESVDNAHSDASPAYMERGEEYVLCHLTWDQLRILWHQRLGHIHSRRVSKMHKHADGIPPVPIATELDPALCVHMPSFAKLLVVWSLLAPVLHNRRVKALVSTLALWSRSPRTLTAFSVFLVLMVKRATA
jgi:hypothetical protein